MVNWSSGKKPVVTCVRLLSLYLPLDYVEGHDKPLPLECDQVQISIQNIYTHCRSNRVDIILIFVYEFLTNSFPDISKPQKIKHFLILQWLLLVPFILSCLIYRL